MQLRFKLILGLSVFLVLSILTVKSTKAQFLGSIITFRATNGGDYPTGVHYIVKRNSGFVVSEGTLFVPAFGSNSVDVTDAGNNGAPYTVTWDPYKPLAADPRDVSCRDPIVTANLVPFDIGTPAFLAYGASVNFACWYPQPAPPPPPPVTTPAVNLQSSAGCESSTSVRVGFSWNLAAPGSRKNLL